MADLNPVWATLGSLDRQIFRLEKMPNQYTFILGECAYRYNLVCGRIFEAIRIASPLLDAGNRRKEIERDRERVEIRENVGRNRLKGCNKDFLHVIFLGNSWFCVIGDIMSTYMVLPSVCGYGRDRAVMRAYVPPRRWEIDI